MPLGHVAAFIVWGVYLLFSAIRAGWNNLDYPSYAGPLIIGVFLFWGALLLHLILKPRAPLAVHLVSILLWIPLAFGVVAISDAGLHSPLAIRIDGDPQRAVEPVDYPHPGPDQKTALPGQTINWEGLAVHLVVTGWSEDPPLGLTPRTPTLQISAPEGWRYLTVAIDAAQVGAYRDDWPGTRDRVEIAVWDENAADLSCTAWHSPLGVKADGAWQATTNGPEQRLLIPSGDRATEIDLAFLVPAHCGQYIVIRTGAELGTITNLVSGEGTDFAELVWSLPDDAMDEPG